MEQEALKNCIYCESKNIVKAGILPSGGQRYRCKDCKKKFSVSTKDKFFHEGDEKCPYCGSVYTRKSGFLRDGTHRRTCRNCGKTFSERTVIKDKITIACPHCLSDNIIHYGHNKGQKQYYCKTCKRAFIPFNQTLKNKEARKHLLEEFFQGTQYTELIKKYPIHRKTLFRWVGVKNFKQFYKEAEKHIPKNTYKDIIFFGLGANVSVEDLSKYLKVDKELVKEVIKGYIERQQRA